jgi:adrenodoxin-NADP+ reductase
LQVASEPEVTYLGNVAVGEAVSIDQLRSLYHVLILAYGAGGDRSLGIPGQDLQGVLSARAFVNWYNGHPEYAELGPTVAAALAASDTIVVIGVGNVALDCARILVKGQYFSVCYHTPSSP